jgi:carbon monoxide dehydrogenase subunit G
MQMSAERRLDASREAVWSALNDVEVLKRSIPGCDKLEWLGDETLDAEVRARIGPMDTVFKGRLTMSERDPPNRYRLSGDGQGAAAGFASGSAIVQLLPDGDGTRLQYDIEAIVGGKLAQLGSRLIDAAARKFADEFLDRFVKQVAPVPAVAAKTETAVQSDVIRSGLKPIVWVPILIALVALILFVFGRL